MTEYGNSEDAAQTQGGRGANLGADIIDLLIRHLETAKANVQGGAELAAEHPTFCTLIYAEPGMICPLLYYHSLTEAESEPVE